MLDRIVDLAQVLSGAPPPTRPPGGRVRRPRRHAPAPRRPPRLQPARPRFPRPRPPRRRHPPRVAPPAPSRPASRPSRRPGPRSWPRCAAASRFLGEALAATVPSRARAALADRGAGRAEPAVRRAAAGPGRRRRGGAAATALGRPLRLRVTEAASEPGGAGQAAQAVRIEPQGRPAARLPGQGSGPRHGGGCVRFGDRRLACSRASHAPLYFAGTWPDYPIAWQIFSSSFSSASRCRAGCSSCRPSWPVAPSRRPRRRRHGQGHRRRPRHGPLGHDRPGRLRRTTTRSSSATSCWPRWPRRSAARPSCCRPKCGRFPRCHSPAAY